MQINYEEIRDAIKKMVNIETLGRNAVRERLATDHQLIANDHQAKMLVKYARYNFAATWNERQQQDAKLIRTLKRITGEEQSGTPSNPFNMRFTNSIPAIEPIDVTEDQNTRITTEGGSLEKKLRDQYDMHDETWIPVTIWGDMRNPMVKWERKKHTVDIGDKEIELRELNAAINLQPSNGEGDERAAVLSIRDAHFGLLTEHPTPYDKYDLQEASSAFISAAIHLMEAALANHVKKLIIPVGSDLLHVDGNGNSTTKGTRQDTNGFWWEAFDESINSVNQVINLAKSNFDEVIVVIEPGNHDTSLARAVGIAMKSAWGNEPKVKIMDEPTTMKRISFGNTHLFMHHGNSIKPNLIQALIYGRHPDVIKPGSYVEVLCGHYHQRSSKKLRESGDYLEVGGMILRITPALCPASNWSESQGYVSSPGAQLTVYDEVGFVSLHEWTPSRMRKE
jgi:hypothetical protein